MSDPAAAMWPCVDRFLSPETLRDVAGRAALADRHGEPALDSIAQLKAANWPGLPIPREFGGGGARLAECCAAQRALASADPGLAIALNMHLFTVGLMVEHWRRRADTSWLLMEAIATQNRLVASAFAEPGLGGSASRSTMVASAVPGGWQVTGTKRPCSLAAEADLVCFHAQTPSATTLVALLPTAAAGLAVRRDWDSLGMRGSASNTLLLEQCFVPSELVFYEADAGDDSDDVLTAGVVWFSLTATACYLGLARSALRAASTAMHDQHLRHLDSSRARLPSYQAAIGDHVAELLAIEAGCAGVAARFDAGAEPREMVASALAVKQRAVRGLPALVDALAETCGGGVYTASGELARLWRDVQAIRFHPPTPVATRQYLARVALGFTDVPLDLDEHPSGPTDRARS